LVFEDGLGFAAAGKPSNRARFSSVVEDFNPNGVA